MTKINDYYHDKDRRLSNSNNNDNDDTDNIDYITDPNYIDTIAANASA